MDPQMNWSWTGEWNSFPLSKTHFTSGKSLFLLLRGLSDNDEFLNRFFGGMTFPLFIQERGSPYREVDLFDRVVADEDVCRDNTISAVDYLAERLMDNERNLYPPAEQKLPQPRSTQVKPRDFPALDEEKMSKRLKRNAERFPSLSRNSLDDDGCDEDEWATKPETVPMGLFLGLDQCLLVTTHDQMAKLNVLHSCLDSIFDNRISDAKKVLRAVKRDLKSRVMRHHLVKYMERQMKRPAGPSVPSSPVQESWLESTPRSTLARAQFELVVELLDEALRQDAGGASIGTLHHMQNASFGYGMSGMSPNGGYFGAGYGEGEGAPGPGSELERSCDCSGIAASVLHLATNLHMQVHNVKYFAYMCEEIQKHAVWESTKFWKSFFHLEVAKQIHELYLTRYSSSGVEAESKLDIVEAMKMAAEELKRWPVLEESDRVSWVAQEERSVCFQIQHCLTQILHFRLPVNVSERRYQQQLEGFAGENASSVMTNSEDGTDSVDRESGFDEHAQATLLTALDNFMRRFVRLVASENDLPQQNVDEIEDKIVSLREGDIATLEDVRREVKRPRAARTEVSPPDLVPNEELLLESPLRVFLLPDSRTDPCDQMREVEPTLSSSTPPMASHRTAGVSAVNLGRRLSAGQLLGSAVEGLLPAEGALFLTNYRVVFRGIPIDCLLTDRQVFRSFPVSALMSVKKHGAQRVPALSAVSKDDAYDVMVLRAANFQLLKLAFEEDVSRDERDYFRSMLNHCRYPLRLEASLLSSAALHEQEEEKAGDSSGKTKSTLTRARMFCKQTMEKARQKVAKRSTTPIHYRSLPVTSIPRPFIGNESKYLHLLQQQPGYQDFARQGLGYFPGTLSVRPAKNEGFKLSMLNAKYQVCRSYPAMLVTPSEVAERSINRLVRGHKEGRIPVVTFRHSPTRALLIRSAGFKHHQASSWRGGTHMSPISEREDTTDCAPSTVSGSEFLQEQEKYLSALVAHSPDPDTISLGNQEPLFPLETPLPGRRDIRDSGRMKNASTGSDRRWSQFYGPNTGMMGGGYRRGYDPELSSCGDQEAVSEWSAVSSSVTRVSLGPLVVLGEKSQMKMFSKWKRASISFLPVVVPHTRKSLKDSFKKLYRVCLTSDQASMKAASNDVFHATLHDVDWLRQVKGTLQLAGAVVDIMDTHGSSVMVALEEGWDLTAQVVSLAELMMDAHYRTLAGFAQLIDKEWLSFGHRFTQRSSLTDSTRPSGYSPVFLLFLDCVHQIRRQFPTRFEFNDYYLQFLAHHHLSNRFSSFKFDSEEERLMYTYNNQETSIWKFIQSQHKESPIFYNFMYVAPPTTCDPVEQVLRPTTNMAALDIWEYYFTEEMASGGHVFDVDVLIRGSRPKPHDAAANSDQNDESGVTSFLQVNYNTGYTDSLMNSLTELLTESGSRWMDIWLATQSELKEQLQEIDDSPQYLTLLSRSRFVSSRVHKKSTRELLYRGRQLNEEEAGVEEDAGLLFKQAHQFQPAQFTTSRRKCDLCSHWLLITARAVVCAQCKFFCHEKCAVNVPRNCSKPSTTASPPPRPPPPPVPPHASPEPGPVIAATARPAVGAPSRPPTAPPSRPPSGPPARPIVERTASVGSLGDGDKKSTPPTSKRVVSDKRMTLATSSVSSLASARSHKVPNLPPPPSRSHNTPQQPAMQKTTATGTSVRNTLSQQQSIAGNSMEYRGYLYKQGLIMRQWKRRYYVLDSLRHQLQYYEDDRVSYRGFIDLNDVRSVRTIRSAPLAPKKIPEHAFIEIESQRIHRFAAEDPRQAKEWCDRLQTAIS